MENNKSKSNLLAIIIMFLIGIIGGGFGYKYFFEQQPVDCIDKCDCKATELDEKEDITKCETVTSVDNEGKVVFDYEVTDEHAYIFNAYLSEGYLYYNYRSGEADGNSNGAFDYILFESYTKNSDMIKYNKLNNISKIRVYNYGTGVDPHLFVIKEDGSVYWDSVSFGSEITENAELLDLQPVDLLKDKKVKDIIETNDLDITYELQDGTIEEYKYPWPE